MQTLAKNKLLKYIYKEENFLQKTKMQNDIPWTESPLDF